MVNNNIAVLRYVRELLEKVKEERTLDTASKTSVEHEGFHGAEKLSYYFGGKTDIENEIIQLLEAKEKELMEEEGL